jgi:hypothetical protein
MRHSNITTTLKYYVDQDADDISAELWASVPAVVPKVGNKNQIDRKTPAKKAGKTNNRRDIGHRA